MYESYSVNFQICEFESGVFKFKSIKIEIRFLSLELIMLTQSFTSGLAKNSHRDPSLYLLYIYTRDK